ncbi:MAG: lipoyl(octanoyl) transferase [Flavobacteriales bacterium]|nr:MAG: lipoyl(octanoyl) transferase [Flavobacteriales bacterium]
MEITKINTVQLKDLGLKDYKTIWDYQEQLFNEIIALKRADVSQPTPGYLLLVEHPHVYTLGKSGNKANLLINDAKLEEIKAKFYHINRGGDITYHGPGQLVGYPILDLDNFFNDIGKYMRLLEETIIRVLSDYGLKGERSKGETGVWLDTGTPFARKICALGVKCSRWVTMHGFALNVNTNLGYFDHIIPCGIKGKAVTSIQAELNKEIDMQEVKNKIITYFGDVFQANINK